MQSQFGQLVVLLGVFAFIALKQQKKGSQHNVVNEIKEVTRQCPPIQGTNEIIYVDSRQKDASFVHGLSDSERYMFALSNTLKPSYVTAKHSLGRKVILTLTTSPSRIQHLYKCLCLIHPCLYDEIHLNIPYKFGRTEQTYTVPVELQHHEKIHIYRLENDIGPASKCVPTIKRLQNKGTGYLCISIDDDGAYFNQQIGELLQKMVQYDCRVVETNDSCVLNQDLKKLFPTLPSVDLHGSDFQQYMARGFTCVAYPAELVPCDIIEQFALISTKCYRSDDLTISYALALQGVPIIANGAFPYILNSKQQLSFGFNNDALHVVQNHDEAYVDAVRQIITYCQQKGIDYFSCEKQNKIE